MEVSSSNETFRNCIKNLTFSPICDALHDLVLATVKHLQDH